MIGITRKGERKVYDIKPIENLTLGDWRAMMMHSLPTDFDTTDQIIELIHRTTTIPVKELRRLPIVEMTRLLDAMTGLLEDIKNERESVVVPKSFKIKKVEHIVPQNLESDVTWAQWEDLNKVLIPKCDTESDIMAAVMSVLCLPEGEEYSGKKAMERMKYMDAMPAVLSFQIYAFFFEKNPGLMKAISLSILKMLTSRLPSPEQDPNYSQPVTDHS